MDPVLITLRVALVRGSDGHWRIDARWFLPQAEGMILCDNFPMAMTHISAVIAERLRAQAVAR